MTAAQMSTTCLTLGAESTFDSFGPALHEALSANVTTAIAEDIGTDDHAGLLVLADRHARARVIVREHTVLHGTPQFDVYMRAVDSTLRVAWCQHEGDRIAPDSMVCEIEGSARSLLTVERLSLNFLQLLPDVATTTSRYVTVVEGAYARVLDTRKALPGLRLAQKYAVRIGGGEGQHLALYDDILIRENHVAVAGGVTAALCTTQASNAGVAIQIGVETLAQLDEALVAGTTFMLLNNFEPPTIHKTIRITADRALLEMSGGVNIEMIHTFTGTGVDRTSVGTLTEDVHATGFSLWIAD